MLKLLLLGNLRILYAGQDLTRDLPVKAQALLVYLAVTGEAHTRPYLATLLWGETADEKALTSLRVALTSLRKALPDHLEVTHQTIAFRRDAGVWLDLDDFVKPITSPAPVEKDVLRQATALYRDEFLFGFAPDDAPAFDEWLTAQRTYYRQTVLRGLARLSKLLLPERLFGEAVEVLTRQLLIEPWDEAAHRQLMLAYSRQGNFNAALTQYYRCCQLLLDELNLEPMAETTALFERIQSARRTRPAALPNEATPFIGRQAELIRLQQLLLNPECRLVTIVGLGGIGKTRLALAVAQQINQEQRLEFLQGVVFVPLAGVDGAQSFSLALAQALGLLLSGQTEPINEIIDALRNKELLLLLDNFEHLLESVDLLTRILQHCPAVKLLVTSREPLQLQAEWRFDLAGLTYPKPEPVGNRVEQGDAPVWEAVQFFVQCAQQVQPRLHLLSEQAAHIQRLCQLVAGMPLALKLAATWLRLMPLERIVAELTENLDLLSTQVRDLPERQRSMRAIFDQTWKQLTVAEQQVWAALSVFRGVFTETAAAKVAGARPSLLAALIDRGLVEADLQASPASYILHELIRQYAAQKLQEQPQMADQVVAQHCHYYAQWLQQLAPYFHRAKEAQAFQAIQQERNNILAAWEFATARGKVATIDGFVDSLAEYYRLNNWFAVGAQLLEPAIARVQALPPTEETQALLAKLLIWQGSFIAHLDETPKGEALLERGLLFAQRAEDPAQMAQALRKIADIAQTRRERPRAQKLIQEALAIYQTIGDDLGVAWVVARQGKYALDRNEQTEAQALLQRSLALCRQHDFYAHTMVVLVYLGRAALNVGEYAAAGAYFEEALQVQRRLGGQYHEEALWQGLGAVAEAQGDYATALRHYEQSLAINRESGVQSDIAYALSQLGAIAIKLGDLPSARRHLHESLRLHKQIEERDGMATSLYLLGLLAQAEGDYATAQERHHQSLQLCESINRYQGQIITHNALGQIAQALGAPDRARTHYQTALQLALQINAIPLALDVLVNVAAHLLAAADQQQAIALLAFVLQHPSLTYATRTAAQALLTQQAANFSPCHLPDLQPTSQSKTLAEVIAELAWIP